MKKRLLGFLALLICSVIPSWAQNANFSGSAQSVDSFGVIHRIANATVTVCATTATGVPCTPTVSIFKSDGTALANPLIADGNGNFSFWAPSGNYQYTVTAVGITGQAFTISVGPGIANAATATALAATPTQCAANNEATGIAANGNANCVQPTVGSLAGLPVTVGSGGTNATTAMAALANLNGAGKPAVSDQVLFVSNNGNDTNDGLSWSTAKLTIAAACAAITNQDSTCTLLTGFGTIYVAPSYTGVIPSAITTGAAPALTVIGPATIQTASNLRSFGSIDNKQDESYLSFHDGGKYIALQAGPRGKESSITGVSITSNVVTFTVPATNPFAAGDAVYISSTHESFLNGQTLTVLSAGLTSTTFEANFTHANYTNSTDTGEGVTSPIKANSTWNLPDAAEGGTVDQSGVLAGFSGLDTHTAGHCQYLSQAGSGNTGGSGILLDSGFGCVNNIEFPASTNRIQWDNGAVALLLEAATVAATRTVILPDPGANDYVAYLAATQTLTNKTLTAPVISSIVNTGTLTLPTTTATLSETITSGTAVMTTAAITAGACGTTVTVAATGVATTDTITWAFNAAPAGTNAGVVAWPTAGNVNFAYCPGVAETPAAATLNWRVVR